MIPLPHTLFQKLFDHFVDIRAACQCPNKKERDHNPGNPGALSYPNTQQAAEENRDDHVYPKLKH
jgi:hypothetical protein